MRQIIIWIFLLLGLNGLLLALHLEQLPEVAEWLKDTTSEGHEPKRIAQQIQPEVVRLESSSVFIPSGEKNALTQTLIVTSPALMSTSGPITASTPVAATSSASTPVASAPVAASAINVAAAPVVAAASAPNVAEKTLCLEVGPWQLGQVPQAKTTWTSKAPAAQIVVLNRKEEARWWVHMPPRGTRAEADKKAGELRYLGVRNFNVVNEPPNYPNTLSLGLFQAQERAENYLQFLRGKGVRTAVVTQRAMSVNKAWLQLKNIPASQEKGLRDGIPKGSEQTIQACRT